MLDVFNWMDISTIAIHYPSILECTLVISKMQTVKLRMFISLSILSTVRIILLLLLVDILSYTLLFILHSAAQNYPTIYRFQQMQNSDSVLSLSCETRTAPSTEITWQRNGLNLTVDGSTIQMIQTVTNRPSSYFTSTLYINDNPDSVVGNYSVIVGNKFGNSTSETISIEGIEMLGS